MKSYDNEGFQVGDVVIVNLNGLCCLGIISQYTPGTGQARVKLSNAQIKQDLADLTFVERTGLTDLNAIFARANRYTENWSASTFAQVKEYPDRFAQMAGIGNCPPFVMVQGHHVDQFVIYFARLLPNDQHSAVVLTEKGFQSAGYRIFAVEVYKQWYRVRQDLQADVANPQKYFDQLAQGPKPIFYIGVRGQNLGSSADDVYRFDLCPYCKRFTRSFYLDTPQACMCSYTEATAPTIPANVTEQAGGVIDKLFTPHKDGVQ